MTAIGIWYHTRLEAAVAMAPFTCTTMIRLMDSTWPYSRPLVRRRCQYIRGISWGLNSPSSPPDKTLYNIHYMGFIDCMGPALTPVLDNLDSNSKMPGMVDNPPLVAGSNALHWWVQWTAVRFKAPALHLNELLRPDDQVLIEHVQGRVVNLLVDWNAIHWCSGAPWGQCNSARRRRKSIMSMRALGYVLEGFPERMIATFSFFFHVHGFLEPDLDCMINKEWRNDYRRKEYFPKCFPNLKP